MHHNHQHHGNAHNPPASRKARLSFLLNPSDEDEGVMMNDNRPRIRPPRFENQYPHLPRDISTTHMRPMRPPTSGMAGPSGPSNGHYNGQFGHSQAAALASGMPKVESAGGASSKAADKRAVRKKRQRKFVCDKCNFGFYTNSDLQKHISSVHLLLRPFKCPMCDKKFGERSNATKHFKSVHERQKNASCDQCHKVFAFRDGLVRHVRLVHDNVRNFHCQYPQCGQSFKQSAHLKKHEQVHAKGRARDGQPRAPRRGTAAADRDVAGLRTG